MQNNPIRIIERIPQKVLLLLPVVVFVIFELIKINRRKKVGTGVVTVGSTKGANISDAKAKNIAEQQLNAMADFGTDESALFGTLAGLSGADLRKVYKAFGRQKYILSGKAKVFGTDLDLGGWYNKELDNKELSKMQTIWSPSGITF